MCVCVCVCVNFGNSRVCTIFSKEEVVYLTSAGNEVFAQQRSKPTDLGIVDLVLNFPKFYCFLL